jgi:assimilatory nitrate reductase catalytic subunit
MIQKKAKPESPPNVLPSLREWDGRHTRDLVLEPGKYGLGQVPSRLKPDTTTTMVCGFCSTGCGLNVHLRDGQAINLTPSVSYPVNLGMACPKGWEALNVLSAADRATTPLLRNPNGRLQPIGWSQAADEFVTRFKNIIRDHGPESVAFLSTGQMPTEELLLLGCLTKFGMGWIHGDSNTRQCMATAAVAYKQSFGFDAPPFTYSDFEESDLLVFVGANPCIGHPIMWERVLRNRRGGKIVVVDPRRTETAQAAHTHLAINPKSDQALFYGVANILVNRGWVDERFIEASTTQFDAFEKFVTEFPIERVVADTGLSSQQIEDFARMIHENERVSFWWTMGVNQSYQGVRTAQSLINLALMTGNMGRPGTGANSITGQCNAMGSRLFSNTSQLLGGREFANVEHRREVAEGLGIPVESIPVQNSLCYDQILDRVHSGKIRGLWIIATNTAHSWVDSDEARAALSKLDFLVVQDMYHSTDTAKFADLILPAAGWGEKEGTMINSERRIGLLKKVAKAPGEALADFHIFRLIAHAWGCGQMFGDWTSPEVVFQKMKRLSQGRPFDISGVEGYRHIDQCEGIQWPLPVGSDPKPERQRRLFADGKFFHPDSRAKFLFDPPTPMPEPTDATYPLVLLTGRGSVAQWHTQTRTGKSTVLQKLAPATVYVEIHPDDAAARGIATGDRIRVSSRRGTMLANAFLTVGVGRGRVFVPMHYAELNALTFPHFDPHSRQPSYKDCAVQVVSLSPEVER